MHGVAIMRNLGVWLDGSLEQLYVGTVDKRHIDIKSSSQKIFHQLKRTAVQLRLCNLPSAEHQLKLG